MNKPKNWLPHDEYIKTLARKISASEVVIKNRQGKILIEKPSYRDHWVFPGGMIDKEESPKETAQREVFEELGIKIETCSLIAVMFISSAEDRPERYQFYFDGGILNEDQISQIKIDNDENTDFKFVSLDKICDYVGEQRSELLRVFFQRKNGDSLYLENWKLV